jgi:hypothetical protein
VHGRVSACASKIKTTAYRVVIDDAQYLILAEREGPQLILHRVEPSGDGLYYLKHHDGIPQPLDRDIEILM